MRSVPAVGIFAAIIGTVAMAIVTNDAVSTPFFLRDHCNAKTANAVAPMYPLVHPPRPAAANLVSCTPTQHNSTRSESNQTTEP
jgi:hypothetical protein